MPLMFRTILGSDEGESLTHNKAVNNLGRYLSKNTVDEQHHAKHYW